MLQVGPGSLAPALACSAAGGVKGTEWDEGDRWA